MVSPEKRFQFIGAFHDVLARLSLLLKQDTLCLCPSVILHLRIYIIFFLQAHNSTPYIPDAAHHVNSCLLTEMRSRQSPPLSHIYPNVTTSTTFMRKRLCGWSRSTSDYGTAFGIDRQMSLTCGTQICSTPYNPTQPPI